MGVALNHRALRPSFTSISERLEPALLGSPARAVGSGYINGLPTFMSETGQAMTAFGNAPLTVTSGVVSHTWNGVSVSSAGYMQTVLPSTVRRVGAIVRAKVTSVCTFDVIFPASAWSDGNLGPAGIHYVVKSDGNWHVSYWDGASETFYASGVLNAWADNTRRRCEITVNLDKSSATIQHPDGSLSVVTDSRIAANLSNYAVWELFNTSGVAEVDPIEILEWWADDSAINTAPYMRSADVAIATQNLLPRSELPQIVQARYNSSTLLSVATTTTLAAPDSTTLKVTAKYGATGSILLTFDGYYEVTSADQVLARLSGGVNTATECILVGVAGDKTNVHHKWVVTGGVPGDSQTFTFQHQSRTVAGSATLKAGGTGATIAPTAVLTAVPY